MSIASVVMANYKKMRNIAFILTLLFTVHAYSQELYFVEHYHTTGYTAIDSLTKLSQNKLTRYACNAGENFYVTKDSKIIVPNLYSLTYFDLKQNKIIKTVSLGIDNSKLTPDREKYLLSFDATPDSTVYYEIASETYRLDKNECKLFKSKEHETTKVRIPEGLNFINFDISPDGKKMAFVYTKEKKEYNIETLFILDLKTSELTKVDTTYSFTFDINEKFTFWDNNELYYLKNGKLYIYDSTKKNIREIRIPIKYQIDNFVKQSNSFYLISKNKLWEWNGSVLKLIYEPPKLNYISTLRIKE